MKTQKSRQKKTDKKNKRQNRKKKFKKRKKQNERKKEGKKIRKSYPFNLSQKFFSKLFFICVLPVSSSKFLENKLFTLLKLYYLLGAVFVTAIIFFELFKAISFSIILTFQIQP